MEVKWVWRGGRVERRGLGGAVEGGGEGEKGEPAAGGEVMERIGWVGFEFGWMEEKEGCCCCCCCWGWSG